jgi:hypothetical protein
MKGNLKPDRAHAYVNYKALTESAAVAAREEVLPYFLCVPGEQVPSASAARPPRVGIHLEMTIIGIKMKKTILAKHKWLDLSSSVS